MDLNAIFRLTDNYTSTLRRIIADTESFGRALPRAERNANSMERALGGLKNKVISLAGEYMKVQNIMSGLRLSDEITNTSARIGMITDNLEEQEALQKKIMQTAKASRGSYLEMANATAKMKMLAGDAFASNDEALMFTDMLNKSLKVTGAGKGDQDAAFLQITQAMASGRLQGDEFRSMTENAPLVANAIAKYVGVSKDELKKLSSEGLITADIVKNALFSASDDINERFNSMPKTFADVGTQMQNVFIEKFTKVSKKISEIINSESFNNLLNSITVGMDIFTAGLMIVLNLIGMLIDNADIVTPIIWGIIGALLVYNATSGIAYLTTLKNVGAMIAKKAVDISETLAIIGLIFAQEGFNAALAACPITWIIIAVIAFIAIIYAAVAAFNKWAGTSISATGIIIGSIMAIGTPIYNLVIYMYNMFAAFVNFLANVFNDPVASITILFLDLSKNVINVVATMVKNIEELVNKIPGVELNISSGMTNFVSGIEEKIKTIKDKSGYEDVLKSKKFATMKDGFDFGYNIGKGIDSKISSIFGGGKEDALDYGDYDPANPGLGEPSNPVNVAGSGKGGAVKVENSEDIELLRKLAMRDYIVRMSSNTLAPQIKVEFSGPITKEADTDAILSKVTNKLKEAMVVAPEG